MAAETFQANLVLALSLLLTVGFGLARLVKLLHLPSVTGYIIAGIALGPTGLNLITSEILDERLQVFTSMALLLVAFSIGERFDLQQLRPVAKTLVRVSVFEIVLVFVLVAAGVTAGAFWLVGLSPAYAIATGLMRGDCSRDRRRHDDCGDPRGRGERAHLAPDSLGSGGQ
ncbi:MAG: hypothetical protein GX131_19995 [candidate division WS1 bacterium]|nr:hypothetical protein [candidate division WS1 bacterium]